MTEATIESNTGTKSLRCYYMDWLRVLATVMVFLFHSAHFFDTLDWHVKNAEKSNGLTTVLIFVFFWIMPLFFLLAGSASLFSLNRRSGGQFARSRLKRLMVPFIFGALVLIPPQKFLEAVFKHGYEGNFFQFLGKFFRGEFLWIDTSLRFFGHYGHHLWFLGFLAVFSLVTIPLFKQLRKPAGRRFIHNLGNRLARPGRIFLLFLPLVAVQFALRPLAPDYLNWADAVYWMLFFLYGYLVFAAPRLQETLLKHRFVALAAGILAFLSISAWSIIDNAAFMQMAFRPTFTLPYLAFTALCSFNTWAWLMCIMGMGKRYLDNPSPFLEYANQAVLPFYVLHQTVVLVLGYWVIQSNLSIPAKLGIIVAASFVFIMVLFEIIRRVPALRFLFGMGKLPPAKKENKETHEISNIQAAAHSQ